jgi:hypothetical protein
MVSAGPSLNTDGTLVGLSEHLGDALENCHRCKPIQGSNPCPSANVLSQDIVHSCCKTLCTGQRPPRP